MSYNAYAYTVRVYCLNFITGKIEIIEIGVQQETKDIFWSLMMLVFNHINSVYKIQLIDMATGEKINEFI